MSFGEFLDMISAGIEKRLPASDIALWAMERYDIAYGIHNHDNGTAENSLSLIKMRPSEDPIASSLITDRLRAFLDLKICTRTGLSWKEFKSLPSWECELIIEQVDALDKRAEAEASAALAKMQGGDK